MGDLTISERIDEETECAYCGQNKAEVVIMDPNVFPANEEKDVWYVCKECRDSINYGMGLSMGVVAITSLRRVTGKDYRLVEKDGKFHYRLPTNIKDGEKEVYPAGWKKIEIKRKKKNTTTRPMFPFLPLPIEEEMR